MYKQNDNAGVKVRNVMFEEVPSEFTLCLSVSRPFAYYYGWIETPLTPCPSNVAL